MKNYSPEEDPKVPQNLSESPVTGVSDQKLVTTYQDTGSILEASEFNVTQNSLRERLINELVSEVTEEDMAKKFKELLNAKVVTLDSDGNVIAERNLPSLQLKTLQLLTQVRGDTAPIKIARYERKDINNTYVMKNGETVTIDDVETTAAFASEELARD